MAALFPQSSSLSEYIQDLERSLKTLRDAEQAWLQNEQTLQAQVQALIQLSQSEALNQSNFQGALQELTRVTAQTLKVERASVWIFDQNRAKIQCLDLFEQIHDKHLQGLELQVADYPNYFAAVESEPLIVACDAHTHPATCELKDGYLIPLNIQSMLDSGFQLDGKVGGVICCEQIGNQRDWSQADQNFIRSAAHLISLIVESHRRKQQAIELQQVLSELEHAQLQIIQTEKMSALGNLVAGVAHEINNPLSCLSGNLKIASGYIQDLCQFIDLYQDKYPDPALLQAEGEVELDFIRADLLKLMQTMEQATKRIQSISKSLRTFSRSDNDQKQDFDLHEGLDSTLLILEHRLKANASRPAIEVVKYYADLPPISCFPGPLNQVFMNLLANAIDALEESNQDKTFQMLEAQPNYIVLKTLRLGNCVRVCIADNGVGIPEAMQKRIFDYAFTTKAVGQGTGLGLAIARQIVEEKHQGKLTVHSTPGQGTEFILELPI